MREGTTLARGQLLQREHAQRQLCRERGRVYHYDGALILEDQPRRNCHGYCEYKGCLIAKNGYGVEFVETLPSGEFPYGTQKHINALTGLWQLPELIKKIDKALLKGGRTSATAKLA